MTTETGCATAATIPTNLNQNERLGSAIAGGALLLFGLNRLSIPAVVLTALGGALLSRGVTGYCPFKAADNERGRRGAGLRLTQDDESHAPPADSQRTTRRTKAGARQNR